jgi:hypothetical protein
MLQSILWIFLLLLNPFPAAGSEEIRTIQTRNNVTLDVLIGTPETKNGIALIMFPGSDGSNHFVLQDGQVKRGKNFLTRTVPDFMKKGFAVAVIGLPSDRPSGMDDDFRTSKEHVQDINKIVDVLAAKGASSIYLVGTSRGTLSAAYAGSTLKRDIIKGVILTSTMGYVKFLRWIPIEEMRYPVFIVHHRDDGCKVTSYYEAKDLPKRFKKSQKVDFVGLEGGLPPLTDPCNALSAHGYYGIEEKAVDVISDWIFRISPVRSTGR